MSGPLCTHSTAQAPPEACLLHGVTSPFTSDRRPGGWVLRASVLLARPLLALLPAGLCPTWLGLWHLPEAETTVLCDWTLAVSPLGGFPCGPHSKTSPHFIFQNRNIFCLQRKSEAELVLSPLLRPTVRAPDCPRLLPASEPLTPATRLPLRGPGQLQED